MVKKDSVRLGRKWHWMQDSAEYGTEAKSRRRVLGVTSRVGVDGDLSSLGPGPMIVLGAHGGSSDGPAELAFWGDRPYGGLRAGQGDGGATYRSITGQDSYRTVEG